MNELFTHYATLKKQIASLELELEGLQAQIFPELVSLEQPLTTSVGTFRISYVPKWQYTPELVEKEKMLKERFKLAKKEEELTGKATKISDGGRIVFSPLKD